MLLRSFQKYRAIDHVLQYNLEVLQYNFQGHIAQPYLQYSNIKHCLIETYQIAATIFWNISNTIYRFFLFTALYYYYSLVDAEMCAASALISIGAVLGKTNPVQLVLMAVLEVSGFVLNEWLLHTLLKVSDSYLQVKVKVFIVICTVTSLPLQSKVFLCTLPWTLFYNETLTKRNM